MSIEDNYGSGYDVVSITSGTRENRVESEESLLDNNNGIEFIKALSAKMNHLIMEGAFGNPEEGTFMGKELLQYAENILSASALTEFLGWDMICEYDHAGGVDIERSVLNIRKKTDIKRLAKAFVDTKGGGSMPILFASLATEVRLTPPIELFFLHSISERPSGIFELHGDRIIGPRIDAKKGVIGRTNPNARALVKPGRDLKQNSGLGHAEFFMFSPITTPPKKRRDLLLAA